MLPDGKYRCAKCNSINDVGTPCKKCTAQIAMQSPVQQQQSTNGALFVVVVGVLCALGMLYFMSMKTTVPQYPVSQEMQKYVPQIYVEELGNKKLTGTIGCGLGILISIGLLIYLKNPSHGTNR